MPRAGTPKLPPKKRLVPIPAANPGRWEIAIPFWRPASLNELLRGGRWGSAKLKNLDRNIIGLHAGGMGIPDASGKRRVTLEITIPRRGRRHDVDAFQKSTLDACTHAKLIRLDSHDWVEWGGVIYGRGERLSTTIIIEDVQ